MPFRPRSGSSTSSSAAPRPDVANFAADLNPDSLEVLTGAMVEPAAAASNADEPMQFERQGYFRRDRDSAPGKPVFVRTVGLRDTFAKTLAEGSATDQRSRSERLG